MAAKINFKAYYHENRGLVAVPGDAFGIKDLEVLSL